MKKSKLVALLLVVVMVFSVSPVYAKTVEDPKEEAKEPLWESIGRGVVYGATVGSWFPLVGTTAGAYIGAVIGTVGWFFE